VAELALDQRQRDPFVQELDGMGVAQLVGREPAPDSCLKRDVAQLDPCSAGGPRPAAGRTVNTQNSAPTGSATRSASHGSIADHAQASIPTSRRRLVLAVPDQNRAAALVEVSLGERERVVDA
jgi:hypothetical protein